jgi:hypothetical protein
MLKVLLMAADHKKGATGLRLDRELRGAAEAVRTGPAAGRLEIRTVLAVRRQDLGQALMEHDADVVQFSGHGSGDGLYMDEGDQVSADEFAALFVPHPRVRVVILNACRTYGVAQALSDVVDYTVAMEQEIEDAAAVVFSGAFYQALAHGRTVPVAFDAARAAVRGRYGETHAFPRLLAREGADERPVLPPPPADEPGAEPADGQVNRFRDVEAGSAHASNQASASAASGVRQVNDLSGVRVKGALVTENRIS